MPDGIFINYRRGDSRHPASRIYDALCKAFGRRRVFMDVDSIQGGTEFPAVLRQALARSGVMVAVIGETWLHQTGADGRRRLDAPEDFVRREIAQAIEQGLFIIPVLLDAASWPKAEEVPDDLKPLLNRN